MEILPEKNRTARLYECPNYYLRDIEKAEEITRIGCEKVREIQNELKNFTEMYDELSKMALKYKCTIIVPTQPDSERNYDIPQELKDRPDVLVIDYFGKI